jgi:hypothetical protein
VAANNLTVENVTLSKHQYDRLMACARKSSRRKREIRRCKKWCEFLQLKHQDYYDTAQRLREQNYKLRKEAGKTQTQVMQQISKDLVGFLFAAFCLWAFVLFTRLMLGMSWW